MTILIYEYDGVLFERAEGKWICKSWAMRGPIGCMMNKEVPEKYAEPIEKAYQKSLDPKEKYSKIRVVGKRVGEEIIRSEFIDEEPEVLPTVKKETKNEKADLSHLKIKKAKSVEKSEPIEKEVKKPKVVLQNSFNPFHKKLK